MRSLFLFLALLFAIEAKSQMREVNSWLDEVRKSVFCKQNAGSNPLAKFDLTEKDTSGYNNGIFMFHTYIGTSGKDYERVLAAIEPVEKLSDNSYSFKMAVESKAKRYLFEGTATIEEVYRYKSLTPDWEGERATVENYFILVRLKATNVHNEVTVDGYYAFYAYLEYGQLNILPGAARSFTPYGDVFAGEIKENGKSVFLQLVPDTYLLGSLPVTKPFLEIDKFQSDMADFDVCRINKKYLSKGWKFTNGEWISTWYSIEKSFGIELYSPISSPVYWNKKD